jgi:hypothetical protein
MRAFLGNNSVIMSSMKHHTAQSGHIVLIVVIILAVAGILAALGYVLAQNLHSPESQTNTSQTPEQETICESGEDEAATNGTFCSEDLGIKFEVPAQFEGKIEPVDNYEIYEGPLDYSKRKSAGKSDRVLEGTFKQGAGTYTLTIAREPVRTGWVGVVHALQNTYYDEETGLLSLVNPPTTHYDSETDTTTTTGEYSIGETAPYFYVEGGVTVYWGIAGDAGVATSTYLVVRGDEFIIIRLETNVQLGPDVEEEYAIQSELIDQFNAAVPKLDLK